MSKGNSVVTGTTHMQWRPPVMEVVGHMPRKICPVCSIFIQRGGSITCTVSDRRRYSADLEQGGLEIPCKIKFSTSSSVEKEKAEKLVTAALSNNETNGLSKFWWGIFGESMQFRQIRQNFPPPNFCAIRYYMLLHYSYMHG